MTLRIAVLSDWEDAGGANIAAGRLANCFSGAGNMISRIYQKSSSEIKPDTKLIPSRMATEEMSQLCRLAVRLMPISARRRRHQSYSERRLGKILAELKPDVISVHNLHIAGWSPGMIRVCAEQAPTVCTLHDTWTFTGRCYNPGSCDKYLQNCDHECPTASEYPSLPANRIRQAFELRREIFSQNSNLAAVTPSRWLGSLAAKGLWKGHPVFKIPYALDLKCYAPFERDKAKRLMGLDPNLPVLLVCAGELSNRKKGVHLLLKALAESPPVQLVLMGMPITAPSIPNVKIRQLGYVTSDYLKAIVYNSADIYVHPSLADNAPLTVIESLACGTPVLSFPIDGLPETVIEEQTGWLADDVSPLALSAALRRALAELEAGKNLRLGCRAFAEQNYRPEDVARKYEAVFGHVISGTNADSLLCETK